MIDKQSLLAIQSSVEAFFISNGFEKIRGDVLDNDAYVYHRKFGRSTESVTCQMEVNDPQTIMSVLFAASKRFEDIERFLDAQDFSLVGPRPKHAATVYFKLAPTRQVYKYQEEEVNKSHDRIATELIAIAIKKVLPILKRYDDIRTLDAAANETFESSEPIAYVFYWGHKLIIAKLAGNAGYDGLYKATLDRFEGYLAEEPESKRFKDAVTVLKRIAERLQDVSPLANSIMS